MSLPLTDANLFRRHASSTAPWTAGGAGRTFAVTNPATGAALAEVADLDAADARAAIEAAALAFPAWAAKTAKERAAVLRAWFGLIMAAQKDLALLMTAEQGKPLAEHSRRGWRTARASSSGSPRRANGSTAT